MQRTIHIILFVACILPTLSANRSAVADEYKVVLKAWIPDPYVVDPETGVDCFISHPWAFACSSKFNGNNHQGFSGSHKVISVVEFDWNGSSMSNLGFSSNYGQTTRYHTLWDFLLRKSYDSHSATQDCCTDGFLVGGTTNIIELSIEANNPLIYGSPNINSDVQVFFYSDGTIHAEGWVDDFPSHGVGIYRRDSNNNWVTVDSCILRDASSIDEWSSVAVLLGLTTNNWHSCEMAWSSGGGGGGGGGGTRL